jgi:prepilin-type N-terminal cleavage/methylation domain-containing protein
MNKQKGFTIIELIVVIAIIAILASIVLVNVTQYINKSRDAAAKGNMATMMTNAAAYLDANPSSTYTNFVGNTLYTNPRAAITVNYTASGTDYQESSSSSAFCFCIKEKAPATTTYYCVDSTGKKSEQTTTACSSECTSGACVN